ncbi:MAG: sulfite exporter TauE/SafE family protein [Desulfobacteraceae bacterium]|jgi:thiol:disulfide interchange protein DsbD
MAPIEQTLLTLPMAMLLGLVFGMGSCTIACLPYLGPVFIAAEGGVRRSWRIILPFSLGRLGSYAALATIAGLSGQFLGDGAAGHKLRWLMGAAAILLGVAILLRRPGGERCTPCNQARPSLRNVRARSVGTMMPGGLFLLGAGMALSPCAPLGSVLFSAAACASAWHGLWLGLGFGLGAIVIPTIFYGIGFAWFGGRLRERLHNSHRHIVRLSAALLILTGTGNLLA